MNAQPRLLDQVREKIRLKHYSKRSLDDQKFSEKGKAPPTLIAR